MHQCEYKKEVEYREVVKFPIQYGETNKSEEIEYIYYARKKGVINNFEKIKKDIEKLNILPLNNKNLFAAKLTDLEEEIMKKITREERYLIKTDFY